MWALQLWAVIKKLKCLLISEIEDSSVKPAFKNKINTGKLRSNNVFANSSNFFFKSGQIMPWNVITGTGTIFWTADPKMFQTKFM